MEAVSGYRLEFEGSPPFQLCIPRPYRLQTHEIMAVDEELIRLIDKKVIEKTTFESGQFVSNIFTRPKKNGKYRMILDLSNLNIYLKYNHFKMDTLETALTLISRNCFMSSIDLRDAYYHIPIAKEHRKYLKFIWKGQMYQFCVLPNGLSSGPRIFTKVLKPPFAKLRELGHNIMGYIDDTLLVAHSSAELVKSINTTSQLLTELGFSIHPEKSIFTPVQRIEFLGVIIDSNEMRVKLPQVKKEDIKLVCNQLKDTLFPKIRLVATVIGKLVAALPAVQRGALYYRELEKEKTKALKRNCGHFDRPMKLSEAAHAELDWWIDNVNCMYRDLDKGIPQLTLETDASGKGWGATDGNVAIGGRWNPQEACIAKRNEINYLELLAVFLALKSFCKNAYGTHVRLKIDNTTAVAYVRHMGGVKSLACNELAKEIWEWCFAKNIWLSAEHLPGVQNVIADEKSRKFSDQTEWMLHPTIFSKICQELGKPDIDMFASRLNKQISRYISWKPDPGAEKIDALMCDWSNWYGYAFPPFCLIGKCLQKIENEKAEVLMIIPKWPTQTWFSLLLRLLVADPIILPQMPNLLIQPNSEVKHPLNNKLFFLACRLSGNRTQVQEYQKERCPYFSHPGENQLRNNIMSTFKSGWTFVVEQKQIQCRPLSM